MMHMTFYWGIQATILFDFWKTQTCLEYSLTLLACLLFSSLYQYLENLRVQLTLPSSSSSAPSPIQTPLLAQYTTKIAGGGWMVRAVGAVLFGVNSALGYMIMLAVMSFNGGVLIAVVVGLSIGYFLFRSSCGVAVDSACACA